MAAATRAKVFPTPRLCGEVPGQLREHPLEREGLAERWVTEHEAGDLDLPTVEASDAPGELQSQVATGTRFRCWRSIRPTARGCGRRVFDRALFGPRAHRYGRPRDLVLGVRVRLAGGDLIRGGGKVVKNVAGYDLPKLFTGARAGSASCWN